MNKLIYETNEKYLTYNEVQQKHISEKFGEKKEKKFILRKMCPPDSKILFFFSNPVEEI
jgi:hypothetical protein